MQPTGALASAQTVSPAKSPPAVGMIKSISGTTIILATDAGSELKISLPADVKYLRVPPGSKDLKEAVPIQLSDLQEGDRVLVRSKPSDDGTSLVASTVIAMKKADISAKQTHEREDWQRRGIGGLVKSTDPSAGTVTIGTTTGAGSKDVEVHLSKTTVLRRYAPNSVKFDDAKPSSLAEIKAGDQLRARGTKSEDGSSFTAEEIVTGAFRNIAGTIESVDAGAATLTVKDLASNKPVQVKITSDSQVRKLPQPIAQRIAMRLKGITPEAAGAASGAAKPATPPAAGAQAGGGAQGSQGGTGAGMGGAPRNGGGDIQQMLSRLPASSLGDFQKGDAVMIVATTAQSGSAAVAITVLGGVEPLLQASAEGQASILTPWSLNSGAGDAGTQ
jgi:cold shock CspA family protein